MGNLRQCQVRVPQVAGSCGVFCIAIVIAIASTGCGARTAGVALDPALATADAQIDFWHTLPSRKVVSNDEAFHALLLVAGDDDPAKDYDGRVAALKQRRMLPAGFAGEAASAAERGTLAVAIVRLLSIEGGLTMRLFGVHGRYAVRELEVAGIYPPSSPHQSFSGAEMLGIVGRIEDYQRTKSTERATAD